MSSRSGRSGKSGSRKVSPMAAANSFTRENLDDLIEQIDEIDHRPADVIKRREAEDVDVDSLLSKMDEVERKPDSVKRKPEEAPPPDNGEEAVPLLRVTSDSQSVKAPGSTRGKAAEEESKSFSGRPSASQVNGRASSKRLDSNSSSDRPTRIMSFELSRSSSDHDAIPRSSVRSGGSRASHTGKNKESVPPKVLSETDRRYREQIQDKFRVLMNQMLEFHIRLREASVRISGYESLRAEMEDTIDELEREKLLLQNQLNHRDSNLSQLNSKSEKIARGNDARRQALLAETQKEDFAFKFDVVANKRKSEGFVSQLELFLYEIAPFAADVRKIQSRFGSAVAAYFEFYRFMFTQFCLVAAPCFVLLFYQVAKLESQGLGGNIFSSKGVVPGFANFSAFDSTQDLLYSSVVIAGSAVFIVSLFVQVIQKDRLAKELDAIDSESETKYAKHVLCAWDFALLTKRQKDEFSGMVAQELLQLLSDSKVGAVETTRTNYEFAIIVMKRVLGFTIYLVLQVGAMAFIVYVTISATQINDNVSNVQALRSLAPFFSAIVISAVNSSLPTILFYITAFEAWDSPTLELNVLLGRMYFSNVFNVLILAGSYALLADPLLLAMNDYEYYRLLVEIQFHSNLNVCRMDQVAEGLLTLLLTSFAIKFMMVILNPLSDYIYAIVTGTPYEKTEFNIASSIVSMLYLATISMLIFPYAPITIVIVPIMLFILLKWEKYVMLHLYRSPKRPWKAQKAGEVFSIFYLLSFFLVGIPSSTFFFSVSSFAKDCSIQDSYTHLCSNSTNSTNNVCSLRDSSIFFDLYNDPTYCPEGYPACICNYACGPFINDNTNITPFRAKVESIFILDYIWEGLFSLPYGPWVIISVLFLTASSLGNSLRVQTKSFAIKETALKTRMDALEASNKDKEKRLQKIKAFESQSNIRESFMG